MRFNGHQGQHHKDSVLTHIQRYQVEDDYVPPNPADEPSTGMPGTQEKLAAMTRRVELGQQLWHHEDRTDAEKGRDC